MGLILDFPFVCIGDSIPALGASSIPFGDVKSGFQTIDHDGWIKLDGRLISTLTVSQQTQALLLGFTTNLPNATDAVAVQNGDPLGSVTGSMSRTIAQGNLPNITLTSAQNGVHTHPVTGASTSNAGSHNHVEGRSWDSGINSRYGASDTGINSDYRASGSSYTDSRGHLVSTSGDHAHTINFALGNSPSHNHTIPLGGAGTALDITPRSMSVNNFVFLGA